MPAGCPSSECSTFSPSVRCSRSRAGALALDGRATAVDGDCRAGDVARARGGKEGDDLSDLLGLRGAVAAGAVDPELLAEQLVQLYDGAQIGARMDRNPGAAAAARAAAAALLDAATGSHAPSSETCAP